MQKQSYISWGLSAVLTVACCVVSLSANRPVPESPLQVRVSEASQGVKQICLKEAAKKIAPERRLPQDASFTFSEDFSKFTKGTQEKPDTITPVASFYNQGGAGLYIDESLMSEPGWSGNSVFQAGGTCHLKALSYQTAAVLNTPEGDYSGHVKVKFRIKALGPIPNQKYVTDHDANLLVTQLSGGPVYPDWVTVENIKATGNGRVSGNLISHVFSESDGWQDMEFEWDNPCSDPNGFIQINCYGWVLIDDITVSVDDSYLPAPTCYGVSNFTKDGFNITWASIRGVSDYEADVWKTEIKGTSPESYSADFEDNQIPQWFEGAQDCEIIDGLGEYESTCLSLTDGTYEFPDNGSKWKDASMMIYVASDENYTGLEDINIYLDAFDGIKWNQLAKINGYNLAWPEELKLNEFFYGAFADNYTGLRLKVEGVKYPAKLIVDNIKIEMGIAQETVQVESGVKVKESKYRVTGIDPNCDYYYQVSSVKGDKKATSSKMYAFGVAQPEANTPKDLDRHGSYTANWEETPRATEYEAVSFGVRVPEDDTDNFVILKETFDGLKTDASDMTNPDKLYNTASSLDEYTSLPGWYGTGSTMIKSHLGCTGYESYVRLPLLDLSHSDNFQISIKAYGDPDDYLTIQTNGQLFYVQFEPADNALGGMIDGTYGVPNYGPLHKLFLYTENFSDWMLDEVTVTQNVKKDEPVFTWLANGFTEADILQYRFTDHGDYDFDQFAYGVFAYRTEGTKNVKSDMSEPVIFKFDINSIESIEASGNNTAEIRAVYGVDGIRRNGLEKGVNIVVRADGSVVKILK